MKTIELKVNKHKSPLGQALEGRKKRKRRKLPKDLWREQEEIVCKLK